MRVLVFGDSITQGFWDESGGWVDRLKQDSNQLYLKTLDYQKNCHQIMNLGISGDTSPKLLKRMQQEIEARERANWPFVFVISIGTNDSRTIDIQDNFEVTEDDYRKNLEDIIKIAKQFSNKIMFVGLTPVQGEQIKFKNYHYSNTRIKKYDEIMHEVAGKCGIAMVEIYKEFEKTGVEKLFFSDHLHPNDAGHELIASLVKPEFEKLFRG